jgi:predicted negative regulator of RcsB-dependent stress response
VSRNLLYLVVVVLVAAVAVLGYQSYQDHKQPDGVQIKVDDKGLEIKNK